MSCPKIWTTVARKGGLVAKSAKIKLEKNLNKNILSDKKHNND
jgi:hypothetical protein